jgi:hypothetical protein
MGKKPDMFDRNRARKQAGRTIIKAECGSCMFWMRFDDAEQARRRETLPPEARASYVDEGECRFNPPQVVLHFFNGESVPSVNVKLGPTQRSSPGAFKGSIKSAWTFPIITSSAACGRFQPRLVESPTVQ